MFTATYLLDIDPRLQLAARARELRDYRAECALDNAQEDRVQVTPVAVGEVHNGRIRDFDPALSEMFHAASNSSDSCSLAIFMRIREKMGSIAQSECLGFSFENVTSHHSKCTWPIVNVWGWQPIHFSMSHTFCTVAKF
jgi:hypothetical protein